MDISDKISLSESQAAEPQVEPEKTGDGSKIAMKDATNQVLKQVDPTPDIILAPVEPAQNNPRLDDREKENLIEAPGMPIINEGGKWADFEVRYQG